MTSSALGSFLRARRARVRPADVGLPVGVGLRRTPGLRREELAALAGVSIDYYTRLERGRETNPSNAVLAALAGALCLDDEARDHLYALANHAAARVPGTRSSASGGTVRPGLRLLLENVRPCPALVLGPTGDILASNPEGLALFHGIDRWPVHRRNTVRYVFLHPSARTLYVDWEQAAAGSVANLRSVLATDPHAPEVTDLVTELTAESREFAALWERYDVHRRRGSEKLLQHPAVGRLALTYEVLRVDDQRVTIYQAAPGTPEHDALSLLAIAASDPVR